MLSYCLSDLNPSDGCVSFPSTALLHPLFKSATPHPQGAELGPVSPAPAHPLKVVEVLLEVGVEGLRDKGLCQCESAQGLSSMLSRQLTHYHVISSVHLNLYDVKWGVLVLCLPWVDNHLLSLLSL